MAINLTKTEEKVRWYYSKDGNQIGPFELDQLLNHIDKYTMVWREGIDWTTAHLVPELKGYFKQEAAPSADNVVNSNSTIYESNLQNSENITHQQMFAAPFSFDGRIRRSEYGISLIIFFFLEYMIRDANSTFIVLFSILLYWFIFAQGSKRCHDRDSSGWYQIIPFYVFWMLFSEGDKSANQYGNPPK